MSDAATRLKETRENSGKSQADFAAAAGVTKRAQVNYENGSRSPKGSYFDALAAAGYDISYIITGTPNPTITAGFASLYASTKEARHRVSEPAARSTLAYRELTQKEDELVSYYRAADKRGKESILTTARALSGAD